MTPILLSGTHVTSSNLHIIHPNHLMKKERFTQLINLIFDF